MNTHDLFAVANILVRHSNHKWKSTQRRHKHCTLAVVIFAPPQTPSQGCLHTEPQLAHSIMTSAYICCKIYDLILTMMLHFWFW